MEDFVRRHKENIDVRYLIATSLLILSSITYAQADTLQLSVSGGRLAPVSIVSSQSKQAKEMADYLRRWIADRGYYVNKQFGASIDRSYNGPQWVVTEYAGLASVGADDVSIKFNKSARDDAYVIDVRQQGGSAIVLLVGKSAAGVRAAVARLVGKLTNDGRQLWLTAGREENDPFIPIRLAYMGKAPRRQVPVGSPFEDIDIEKWPVNKLRAYSELFWQFGYNGIEIAESRGYASISGAVLKRVQMSNIALAQGARSRGMYVWFSQWGDCPFKEGESYSWNNSRERTVLIDFMNELAGIYGPYIDHINIHIGDPGGCTRDGCDFYKTPQQITAAFLQAFRKTNPRISASLSTWANNDFWAHSPNKVAMSNYLPWPGKASGFNHPIPDGAKFLDDTFMPREIGIAIPRVYDEDEADLLVAAGRAVDVWGWYIADMEMINNIWLNMHFVDALFSDLPDKARNQVRSQTIETCFHGWPQIINSYIGAQKLWNPKRSLSDIEHEFCVAAFGPTNADVMVELYNACENGKEDPIPHPSDFGTALYNARLRRVLASAQKVSIPADWKPNFAFPVQVQKYVDMLKARLQLTLAVSEAKEQVDQARAHGASDQEVGEIKRRTLDFLPKLPIDPIYSQDASVINQGYRTDSIPEMIQKL